MFCQIKSDIDHRQKNRHGDFIESDIDHKEWRSTQLLSQHYYYYFFLRNWPICDLRICKNVICEFTTIPLPLCTVKTEFVQIFVKTEFPWKPPIFSSSKKEVLLFKFLELLSNSQIFSASKRKTRKKEDA
jgi:hypothetical protein